MSSSSSARSAKTSPTGSPRPPSRRSCARTFVMDPRILISDDSMASVDPQPESLIQQAPHELMKERTTFVIAQRLRTIMRADEIVVLDRGEVIQRGRHDDLVAADGLYR